MSPVLDLAARVAAVPAQSGIRRGAFIVFEGADRAGKSTQCKKLVEHLTGSGVSTFLFTRAAPVCHISNSILRFPAPPLPMSLAEKTSAL